VNCVGRKFNGGGSGPKQTGEGFFDLRGYQVNFVSGADITLRNSKISRKLRQLISEKAFQFINFVSFSSKMSHKAQLIFKNKKFPKRILILPKIKITQNIIIST
jgi:hypothetical protein